MNVNRSAKLFLSLVVAVGAVTIVAIVRNPSSGATASRHVKRFLNVEKAPVSKHAAEVSLRTTYVGTSSTVDTRATVRETAIGALATRRGHFQIARLEDGEVNFLGGSCGLVGLEALLGLGVPALMRRRRPAMR